MIKKIFKRLFIGILLLGFLGTLLGFIFYDNIEEWITSEVQDYLVNLEYGDLEIEEMELDLMKHFPNMTVKMGQTRFFEQVDSLRSVDEPPILYAETFNLTLNSWELVKRNNLVVTILSIENGGLNLLTYEDNKTNLERAFNPPSKDESEQSGLTKAKEVQNKPQVRKKPQVHKKPEAEKPLTIELKEIRLKNIHLKYQNPSEEYASQIELADFQGDLELNKQGISCTLNTNFEIVQSLQLPTIAEQGPMTLTLDLDFIEASKLIDIHEGNLNFKNLDVAVSGSYDHGNGNYVDMVFDASSNNLAFLSKLVQEDILHKNTSLVEQAKIMLQGTVKGKMEDQIPLVDVNFGIDEVNIELPDDKGRLNDFGFEGEFHSGTASDFSSAKLSVQKLRGNMPGGTISGKLDVHNFKQPYVQSNLHMSLDLDGFDDVFHLANIDSLEGKVDFVLDMDGLLNLENQHEMDSIGSWSLKLQNIGFKYLPSNKFITNLNGDINESNNQMKISNLGLSYDKSNVNINGHIQNLYHFIFNKEQDLLADFEITSDQIFTEHIITNPEKKASLKDRMSDVNLNVALKMNDNDIFDSYFPKINVTLKNLSFDLDKLPNISKIESTLDMYESKKGFNLEIHDLDIKLPKGETKITGAVLIPNTSETMDINTTIDLADVPKEYVVDLLSALKDRELLGAKNMANDELTLINGKSSVAGIMELVPFALQKARISNANIGLKRMDSTLLEVRNLNLNLDGLFFTHKPGSKKIAGIENAKGELHIDALNSSSLSDIPIDIGFIAKNSKINVSFSTLRDTVMLDKGTMSLDISKSPLELDLSYTLENIDIETVLSEYSSEDLMQGTINASTKIKGVGNNMEELLKNLEGDVNIRGDSLLFHGIDLDDLLRKYKRSQKFNLADISAFVMAGPFGAAVTKGADFTSLISADFKPEHETFVAKAIANWKIGQGIIATDDVAFSTRTNRLAFEGSLDFVNDSIPGFTVYVIDKKGCSLMQQDIFGRYDDIQMGKLKIAKTLLGSIINLVNSVVGSNCEAVYNGSIAHPDVKK